MAPAATPSIDGRGALAAEVADVAARIGPNAVIQLIAALKSAGLERRAAPVFIAAGAGRWLRIPPSAMVDERPVARLHQALRAALSPEETALVMARAGRLTADYLLANRIPRPVQGLLKSLPTALSSRLLLAAIGAHAWTFAGSGRFQARAGRPVVVEIADNPLCGGERSTAPVCGWHAAVFARLFQALISPNARVIETRCQAAGDDLCRFEIAW